MRDWAIAIVLAALMTVAVRFILLPASPSAIDKIESRLLAAEAETYRKTRRSHAVYLTDTEGDCVEVSAVYGMGLGWSSQALLTHVDPTLCVR